jgi:hypothetical protein
VLRLADKPQLPRLSAIAAMLSRSFLSSLS